MALKFLKEKNISAVAIICTSTFLIAWSLSQTVTIAIALSTVVTTMAWISSKKSQTKRSWEIFSVLPEIIDHMISGIQSGLSLSESLSNLAIRGPKITQTYFEDFKAGVMSGESFEDAISEIQEEFNLRSADQLFESLIFAKNLGGSELLSMLRQLGDFTRQDLSLRREIAAKQGWIRNSAHLSAAAPWILLLLLSTQPSTSAAFKTPQGASILAFGVAMTGVAYLWLGRLSDLPEPRRIFSRPQ